MSHRTSRPALTATLALLWLLPLAATALFWVDAHHTRYFLMPASIAEAAPEDGVIRPENLQQLKQSILNVRVALCDGSGWSGGTAFVVHPGYVATAAHVVKEAKACASEVTLVDYRGLEHPAELEGYSDETQLDLALLSFGERELTPLELADSSLYESSGSPVPVVTIGYPPGASTADEAAMSGSGLISSYRDERFFTSGMSLNPGNSGGPVFVMADWKVLGVATGKGDAASGGEGLGIVVPSEALERFFEERVGQVL